MRIRGFTNRIRSITVAALLGSYRTIPILSRESHRAVVRKLIATTDRHEFGRMQEQVR
jgi:hypothetical protein